MTKSNRGTTPSFVKGTRQDRTRVQRQSRSKRALCGWYDDCGNDARPNRVLCEPCGSVQRQIRADYGLMEDLWLTNASLEPPTQPETYILTDLECAGIERNLDSPARMCAAPPSSAEFDVAYASLMAQADGDDENHNGGYRFIDVYERLPIGSTTLHGPQEGSTHGQGSQVWAAAHRASQLRSGASEGYFTDWRREAWKDANDEAADWWAVHRNEFVAGLPGSEQYRYRPGAEEWVTDPRIGTELGCGMRVGTDAGWKRHNKRGQKPCDPCRREHNKVRSQNDKNRRLKKKAAKEVNNISVTIFGEMGKAA